MISCAEHVRWCGVSAARLRSAGDRRGGRRGPRRLPVWVLLIAGLVVAGLMVVAGRYGFHRDEYYFVVTGQHPAVAAPDNPMLVPYLAAGWYAVVGGHLWAFRILPALAMGGYVVLGGLIAREFSASRATRSPPRPRRRCWGSCRRWVTCSRPPPSTC